jgi:UDP-N-acetylglucosamine diphosphorylase/glucosamine-1-phosphate N-acetyltransferase
MTTPLRVVLYDDAAARSIEPFALTRPISEVRAGAELIRERWERVAGAKASGFIGAAHLATFSEFGSPPAVMGVLAPGTLLVNSRFAPAIAASLPAGDAWTCDGHIAAVRLAAPLEAATFHGGKATLDSIAAGSQPESITGWWLHHAWDLIAHLPAMLAADVAALAPEGGPPPAQMAVIGEHDALVARGAYIEPYVLADTIAGPVLVRRGARICAFSRLVGPCIIGENAVVAGGRVAVSSIGDHARVHGEVSTTIVIGHANKAHDGFVGHTVVGRWANLGAGTITSNLKNSYGTVALWTPHGVHDSGLQFLGAMIGDHAKTGIGTRLTTGTVIGAGASVFGSRMLPKFVPPFAWGDEPPYGVFELAKFLEVAARVMARRETPLSDGMRDALRVAWTRRGQFTP